MLEKKKKKEKEWNGGRRSGAVGGGYVLQVRSTRTCVMTEWDEIEQKKQQPESGLSFVGGPLGTGQTWKCFRGPS